jgi:hypothetical protein
MLSNRGASGRARAGIATRRKPPLVIAGELAIEIGAPYRLGKSVSCRGAEGVGGDARRRSARLAIGLLGRPTRPVVNTS